jgi:hypothetical protein
MKVLKAFIFSAGVILLFTAAAKLISSTGNSKALFVREPLTGWHFRDVLCIVGAIEIAVAMSCFFCKRLWVSNWLIAWISTCFLFYRAGLLWIGYHGPCKCLGSLADSLHISQQAADSSMKIVLAYLLVGSYGMLFKLWRQHKSFRVIQL